MRLVRSVLVISFALGLTACGRAASEGSAANAAPRNAQSEAETSAADNIADAASIRTLIVSDLRLPLSSYNDNDSVLAKLTKLPGSLAPAAFGFFDDKAILKQLGPVKLIEMQHLDFGFRFVADLDHNGQVENYRTGWFQLPGQDPGQFLAVFERGALRDLWKTEDGEPLVISWRDGVPTLFPCNCPTYARIAYAHGKLQLRWTNG